MCCNWLLRSLGSSFDNSSVKDGKEFEEASILVRAASSCAGSPQARGTASDSANVLSAVRVWEDAENKSNIEVDVINFCNEVLLVEDEFPKRGWAHNL